MKFKNNINSIKGFTLIELIIYIAIIGIIVSGFISYFLSVGGIRNKNYSVSTVQSNGRNAMQIMERKIHEAQSVSVPSSGASSTVLVLISSGGNASTTFSILNGVLFMKETGVATTTITDNKITISNLTFTNLSPVSSRANIHIEMTINYNVGAGDTQFGYNKSYKTSVSTRI